MAYPFEPIALDWWFVYAGIPAAIAWFALILTGVL
jgi:hypothetical protein